MLDVAFMARLTWITAGAISLILSPITVLAAPEKLECEGGNKNVMHILDITVDGGKVQAFSYSGMTLAAAGDTYYTCAFEARRGGPEAEWTDEGATTGVKFTDSAKEDDHAAITKTKDTYAFEFDMAPTNCGHSSVFARTISITKGKKRCHSIDSD